MGIPQRMTIVTIGVASVARSRAFYEALGWQASAHSDEGIVWFGTSGSALGIFESRELSDDAGLEFEAPAGFRNATMAVNLESPEAVDAAWQVALAAGAIAVKEPQTAVWGGHSGYFADPDGHLWELVFVPNMQLGADGRLEL